MNINNYKATIMDISRINVDQLTDNEAQELLSALFSQLQQYDKAYYNDDNSLVSDTEYDLIKSLSYKIANKFPYLTISSVLITRVGCAPNSKFTKVTHLKPMLSLSNAWDIKDISNFINKIQKFLKNNECPIICCEHKIDGISFSARYKYGKLEIAATRGDGQIGEDITNNVKSIVGFPETLPIDDEIFEVRGEIYITKDDFKRLNVQQLQLQKPIFANPRNAAAGSVRQLDYKITAQRPLKYCVYALGAVQNSQFVRTQFELLNKLYDLGFSINTDYVLSHNLDDIVAYYKQTNAKRDILEYEIDGVVYKVNDFALQERLGYTSNSPRFALAHKFPALIAKTQVKNIMVQVGKTGAITPVAELEPVKVAGAVISRASLHNYDEIQAKDIRIGDYVFLQRAGDVIPQIKNVDLSARLSTDTRKFTFPIECPSCGSKLVYDKEEVVIRCRNNLNCPAQLYERMCHFVSRDALNIEGLGKKQMLFLLEKGYIDSIIDLLILDKSTIALLPEEPGWGIKSVNNLLLNINQAKNITLEKFIYALAIRYIGVCNAKILAQEFKAAEEFIAAMLKLGNGDADIYNKLSNIDGVGHKIIRELQNFFANANNINFVTKLMQLLHIQDLQVDDATQSNGTEIRGKIIVFTGSFTHMSRAELKLRVERLGAKVHTHISSNTDLLIVGSKAGSKLTKAQNMGIKIISEVEFYKIIGDEKQ